MLWLGLLWLSHQLDVAIAVAGTSHYAYTVLSSALRSILGIGRSFLDLVARKCTILCNFANANRNMKPIHNLEILERLQLFLECEEEIRRLRAGCVRQNGDVLIATTLIGEPMGKKMRLESAHERGKDIAVHSWFAVAGVEDLEVVDVYVGNAYRYCSQFAYHAVVR